MNNNEEIVLAHTIDDRVCSDYWYQAAKDNPSLFIVDAGCMKWDDAKCLFPAPSPTYSLPSLEVDRWDVFDASLWHGDEVVEVWKLVHKEG